MGISPGDHPPAVRERAQGGATLEMVTVRHAPTSAGEVRRRVGADLSRRGLPDDVVDDATLLASELVGNAVRYAHPLPGGVLRVAWSVGRDCVRLRVTDGGGPSAPRVRDAGPSDVRGRGLAIVDSLARAWGVHRSDRGPASTVWAELPV
jgi:anti-sigma regulatory factor (Ser/Thr protein kinase)